jgi:hypothetical protein
VTDIEMVFEAGEPPEGIMRMIEPYTGLITPQTKTPEAGKPTETPGAA